MSVFRVYKNKDYTTISNLHLKDKNLSLKAKGLLSIMLSLPDDWNYSLEGLVAICKENETAVNSALKELKEFNYLEVLKLMPNQTKTGRIEYIYNIYEKPKQEGKKQGLENLGLENLELENIGLYKDTNNKDTNNKDTNILENKSSKILEEKNIKKSFSLGKPKKMTQKEKLYHKLLDETLVKSPLYQKDVIRDLLVRWINALYEVNKLPSSISLEDSLLELNKYDDNTIIDAINNSIKSNYSRFYPNKKSNISSDGINRDRELTDYEIQKQEESYKYIEDKYGK